MTAARSRNEGKSPDEEKTDETKTFKKLISYRANINQTDIYGQGAIHYAVMRNNANFLELLLQCSDLITELKDKQGMTPVHFAAVYGHYDMMKMLVDHGINLLAFDTFCQTPLHLAASAQDDRICKLVLTTLKDKYSTDFHSILDMRDVESKTPLHIAIEKDNFSVAKMLISWGSDCNKTSYGDNHPIHLAAKGNSVEIINLLISSKIDVNSKNVKLETPLHIASAYDKPQNIEILLNNKAKIEEREIDRFTPLMLAASFGNLKSVEILLKNNARIPNVEKNDRNSIFLASQENQSAVLTMLLEHCGDVIKKFYINISDRFGENPLHKASENGYCKIVQILLNHGANSSIKNDNEQTAMHLAAQNGFIKVVEILTKSDITLIHGEDENSNSPLHLAAQNGHKDVVKFLIENNADIEARNQFLWTPLDCAAYNGNVKVCKILLEDDAPIDAKDRASTTPLHLASAAGHSDVVSLLIEEGADVNMKDANGFNSLDRAIHNNHKEVAQTILSSPKWRESLRNKYYCQNRREIITPLRELIQKMPDVAYSVLSSSITTNNKSNIDPDQSIMYNYEFLDDLFVNWSEGDNVSLEDVKEIKINQKIVHTLEWMVKYKKKELLGHPLSRELIHTKWVNYGQYFFYINLILSLLFTISLTTFLYLSKSPNLQNTSITGCHSGFISTNAEYIGTLFKYAAFVVSGVLLLREISQFIRSPFKYFSFINLMDTSSFCLCIVSLLDVTTCNKQTGIRASWQWQLACISVFLGCMNTILIMQKVSMFGIYVVMFFNILKTFLNLSIILILFITSFGIVFHLLLENQIPFQGFGVFLKASVMMIGEIEYTSIFYPSEQIPYPYVTYPIFVLFIIFMIIVAMNLLVGLAVDDIKGVQEEAMLQKIAKQVELVMEAERFLGKNIIKKFADKKHIFYPNRKIKIFGYPLKYDRPIQFKTDEGLNDNKQNINNIYVEQEKIKLSLKNLKKGVNTSHKNQRKIIKMLVKLIGENESDIDTE